AILNIDAVGRPIVEETVAVFLAGRNLRGHLVGFQIEDVDDALRIVSGDEAAVRLRDDRDTVDAPHAGNVGDQLLRRFVEDLDVRPAGNVDPVPGGLTGHG